MPPRRSEKDQAALYDGARQWVANLATWNEPALRELLDGNGQAQERWRAMHDETNAPRSLAGAAAPGEGSSGAHCPFTAAWS